MPYALGKEWTNVVILEQTNPPR
eukprot:SAG31_NODE_19939_length_588_cov_0.728016_1_plen_22_part_10